MLSFKTTYIFINNLFMNLFHKLKCILRCVFAELINRFHEIPIKTKSASFENIDKSQICMGMQKAEHSQTISRKKKNVGGLLLPDFNTYYEILITQNNVVLPSG